MSQGLRLFLPAAAAGERITPVLVGDQPLDLAGQYAVVVNSFLASGGDNFTALAQGSNPRDSGRVLAGEVQRLVADEHRGDPLTGGRRREKKP